jgi:hypothetical protein
LPVENPVPVHEVAFVDDHVSVEFCPDVTEVGFEVSLAVGEEIARTSTPSTLAFWSGLLVVGANEIATFPLTSATAVKVFTMALCCAPVAAKISKLEGTREPLMLTLKSLWPAAVQ